MMITGCQTTQYDSKQIAYDAGLIVGAAYQVRKHKMDEDHLKALKISKAALDQIVESEQLSIDAILAAARKIAHDEGVKPEIIAIAEVGIRRSWQNLKLRLPEDAKIKEVLTAFKAGIDATIPPESTPTE
jgi:hypothetical protein